MRSKTLLSIYIFTLFSCTQKSIDFELVDDSNPYDFYSIAEFNDTLFAVSGDLWTRANLSTSTDGKTWTHDSLTNKAIFNIQHINQTLYAVGVDGYIFYGNPPLKFKRTNQWEILRSISSHEKGFIAVGGKDFNKGWIYILDESLSIIETLKYPFQLMDIDCTNEYCIAVGFGNILMKYANEITWNRIDQDGDFYTSIDRNNDNDMIIVGNQGSILKIEDRSKKITTISNGSLLNNSVSFNKVKFYDQLGFIVGHDGAIWKSEDNGNSWEDISIDDKTNLYDFELRSEKLILVGDHGRIISYAID